MTKVVDRFPSNSWYFARWKLAREARRFDPAVRLRVKRSRVWRLFNSGMAITIGSTVFIPPDWTSAAVRRVLPHEVGGHVRQYRFCGLGIHPAVGIPIFLLLYALPWVRYRLELHAETREWVVGLAEGYLTPEDVLRGADAFAAKVGGRPYLWAVWPSWARRGSRRRARRVIADWEAR